MGQKYISIMEESSTTHMPSKFMCLMILYWSIQWEKKIIKNWQSVERKIIIFWIYITEQNYNCHCEIKVKAPLIHEIAQSYYLFVLKCFFFFGFVKDSYILKYCWTPIANNFFQYKFKFDFIIVWYINYFHKT